jgi:hypothetical protein
MINIAQITTEMITPRFQRFWIKCPAPGKNQERIAIKKGFSIKKPQK